MAEPLRQGCVSVQAFYSRASDTNGLVVPDVDDPSRPDGMSPGIQTTEAEQAKALAPQQRRCKQSQSALRRSFRSRLDPPHLDRTGRDRTTLRWSRDVVTDRPKPHMPDDMRHRSVMSIFEGNEQVSMAHSARARKDGKQMDKDERLLASEEGKKLSSKERRHLSNKLSARAFRSRRNKYTSQLEDDLSRQVTDASELRMLNLQLMEENHWLKVLTRTTLSHRSFLAVLDGMSHNSNFNAGLTPRYSGMPIDTFPPESAMSQRRDEAESRTA